MLLERRCRCGGSRMTGGKTGIESDAREIVGSPSRTFPGEFLTLDFSANRIERAPPGGQPGHCGQRTRQSRGFRGCFLPFQQHHSIQTRSPTTIINEFGLCRCHFFLPARCSRALQHYHAQVSREPSPIDASFQCSFTLLFVINIPMSQPQPLKIQQAGNWLSLL